MKNSIPIILFLVGFLFSTNGSCQKIDLLILNQEYENALNILQKEISSNPNGDLYFKQGVVYAKLNDFEASIKSYKKALDYSPNNPVTLAELGETLALLGNYSQAAFYYKQSVIASNNDLVLKSKLGRVYINLDQYGDAYEVFHQIYALDSTNIYWDKQYAYCITKTGGDKRKAINLYEYVLARNPYDLGTYSNLATLYYQAKQDSLGLKTILNGLKYFPENGKLQLKRANHYYGKKQYAQAAENYSIYLAKNDSAYDVLKNYGISLYFADQWEKAVLIIEKCIQLKLDDPYTLFYTSLSYKKLANHEVAEAYMKTAIEASTPYYLPEMYHHLAQILGQQRKYEESIAALKEAYEMDPLNFELLFEIATTYEEYNNNKTLALNFYRMYLMEAKDEAKNATYALNRMDKIKEILFMNGN